MTARVLADSSYQLQQTHQSSDATDKPELVREWLNAVNAEILDEAASEMGESIFSVMTSSLTTATSIWPLDRDQASPSGLTTMLLRAAKTAMLPEPFQSIGHYPHLSFYVHSLIVDDMPPRIIRALFAFENYSSVCSTSKTDQPKIIDEVFEWASMLACCPFSPLARRLALEVSLAYILSSHEFTGLQSVQRNLLAKLFAILASSYPDTFVAFALASSYLRMGDYYNGLSIIHKLSTSGSVNARIRETCSTVVNNWNSSLVDIVELSPLLFAPHILTYTWRAPSVFNDLQNLPPDFPYFIALTQIKVDDSPAGVRVDQLKDYVVERWGELGLLALKAYQKAADFVLKNRYMPHVI